MTPEQASLVTKFIDNDLSSAEAGKLLKVLKNDPCLLDDVSEEINLHYEIESSLSMDQVENQKVAKNIIYCLSASTQNHKFIADLEKRATEKPKRHHGRRKSNHHSAKTPWQYRLIPLALAAGFAFMLYYFSSAQQIVKEQRRIEATIVNINGTVNIKTSTGTHMARRGESLYGGMNMVTGPKSQLTLAYPDGSLVEIEAHSHLLIKKNTTAMALSLLKGTLRADISKQPPDSPMRIYSKQALITVLGTRFTLSAKEHDTYLSVQKGRVRFTRVADNYSVVIAARQEIDTKKMLASNISPTQKKSSVVKNNQKNYPHLLFKSGFEGGIHLNKPSHDSGKTWVQNIHGGSSLENTWPPKIWGGTGQFLVLVDSSLNHDEYIQNRLITMMGPHGKQTQALHAKISKQTSPPAQSTYTIEPGFEKKDLYVKYWLKLPGNLKQRLNKDENNNGWHLLFHWGTASDYRVAAYIYTDDLTGKPYWHLQGDNVTENTPMTYQRYWSEENRKVPVPEDKWFKVEFFWHRSTGKDGRFRWAINDKVVIDHRGPNKIKEPIQNIALFSVDSGVYPFEHWVDDIEIRD